MANSSLTINIRPKSVKTSEKVIIEMDVNRFERLAADFGFFNRELLESLERAERQVSQKKIKRLHSLRDLRA